MADARSFAYAAHFGQNDRDGQPHMAHVERVVAKVLAPCVEVAYLHDVVEDTAITFEYLRFVGFNPEVVQSIRLLTREAADIGVRGSYLQYVEDIANSGNLVAIAVKLADLQDNLHRSEKDANMSLVKRYSTALKILGES